MVKSTCIVAIRSYIPPQQDTSGNFRRQLLTGVSHWRMITQNQSFKELSLSLLSHCLQSPLEKLCWLDVVAPVTLPFWRQGQDDWWLIAVSHKPDLHSKLQVSKVHGETVSKQKDSMLCLKTNKQRDMVAWTFVLALWRQVYLGVQSQPGIQSEFQDIQDYTKELSWKTKITSK